MSKSKASDQLLALLQMKIRAIMNDVTDGAIGGGCKDYGSYTHACGIVQGLALAERELLDIDDNNAQDVDVH